MSITVILTLPTPDPNASAVWLAEIVRRAREVETGSAVLEDWSAVRERLLARRREKEEL